MLSYQLQAQFKTDVLVVGGSASGVAAAIQSARSGVKTILIEKDNVLFHNKQIETKHIAFDAGIWKEWQDSCKKHIDSVEIDCRKIIEKKLVEKTDKLQYLKNVSITEIKEKGKNWIITITRNGKKEDIKAKILVDAVFEDDITAKFKLTSLNNNRIKGISSYTTSQQKHPYEQQQKLYRTSGATGFGKDSTILHFIPIGAFIPVEKINLLTINKRADLPAFNEYDLAENIPLWANIGQMIGALAAYGPFFDTTPDKANLRLIQSEVIDFKGFIFPVLDIDKKAYSYIPVQKIIASQILKLDFSTGKFNPYLPVLKQEIRTIFSELHPRSRIWFMENNTATEELTLEKTISLFSFISGREYYSIDEELTNTWKKKYQFDSEYNKQRIITREEFAVLLDDYLNPFTIRVNMSGSFIR